MSSNDEKVVVTTATTEAKPDATATPTAKKKSVDTSPYREIAPWKGLQHWECNYCTFDSLDELAMQDHTKAHTIVNLSQPNPPTQLVDRFGQPVTGVNNG